MDFDLLVFRGPFGSFVDYRSYSGRVPPEISAIEIDGEEYSLSLYEYHGDKYLVAHQEKMESEPLELAINDFRPSPLN
ncbi:hypothetical protein QU803_17185 [Enterobacter hormaechei subsp. steigerwaltii]|uniref:hypothetical protein n=1 Tax=Enterobacter hormaechei TaxID=158836 RepID=UPI0022316743|nr:hypothetical protein [Enterobacter hormaechei]MDM9326416.1 hypothetical protein [Enterobacter hormaechei subsp. steigerwaltii]